MLIQLFWFVCGLLALVAGAHVLVKGASNLASAAGISPLVIGLTIVAMGTSSPEIAVSVGAAFSGAGDLALGNVVGSNIFNVLFILGLTALVAPLVVQSQLIRQEVPLMIAFSLLLILLSRDDLISRADGALLMVLMLAYTTFLILQSRRSEQLALAKGVIGLSEAQTESQVKDPLIAPDGNVTAVSSHWAMQLLLVAAGLVLLVMGAGWLVDASIAFARVIGISEVVIGLTVVAAGTSMPELATSVVAALRGERDIAVGNIVGSNIFNILACLGMSGLVSPSGLGVAPSIMAFDFWVMLAVAFICLPVFFSGRSIARWEGAVLLAYYVAYTAYLVLAAKDHDALPLYSNVMLMFVLPLSGLALLTSVWKTNKAD
jgi:cation:H+ antiporter